MTIAPLADGHGFFGVLLIGDVAADAHRSNNGAVAIANTASGYLDSSALCRHCCGNEFGSRRLTAGDDRVVLVADAPS